MGFVETLKMELEETEMRSVETYFNEHRVLSNYNYMT